MHGRLKVILLASAFLSTLLPLSSTAQMTAAFGPKKYTRKAGAPQTFHDTFAHCGTQACRIVITNGNPNGTNRLSSASVRLNGVLIAGPSNFNQKVASIVKPVGLAATNQLAITLASNPGGFLTIEVDCTASPVVLTLGNVGDSLNSNTLSTAAPILNSGTGTASNLTVTSLTLTGGVLSSPPLPLNLGSIAAGGSALLNANFTGTFTPLGNYGLEAKGTYAVGSSTFCFTLDGSATVPPAAPGSGPLGAVNVPSNTITGAPFPPVPPDEESETNLPGWTVPNGPFVPGGPPPGSTGVTPAPIGDPPAILFNLNHDIGITSGVISPAEPSGASGGGVVFMTANKVAGYSTDGGNTFTALDPTKIFPTNDAIGFCCDQIVQYVSSIDRFVWLLQGANYQGYRLAVAKPADVISSKGTAWTYWNLPDNLFGTCTSFDYPDLALGNGFLYISWDAGGKGCSRGLQVARTSFTGLQAGGTITLEFTNQSDGLVAWGSHLMQNTGDEIFWAGQKDNSTLRVFSLQEASTTYFWRDITVSTWANNTPITSNTPDVQNWLTFMFNPTTQNPGGGFPNNAVLGATRNFNQLWFAWSAGTDSNFKQPHIEMVTLDRFDNFKVIQQVQVWNANYAFAYPALATNGCTAETGMSFEFGGGGNYENHVVGFWGDFIAYITTESDSGSTRFGDYVTIRQAPATSDNPGNLFDAFGYGINTVPAPGSGTTTDVHYVQFGRPSSSCAPPIK